MSCPKCHTAGSYRFVKPFTLFQLTRAKASEPVFHDVLRAVKRQLGPGQWVCAFCHYEWAKAVPARNASLGSNMSDDHQGAR